MGKRKKVRKSIESYQKRIEEHEKKIKGYKEGGGRDYALVGYWEKEKEGFEKKKKEEEEKLEK